MESGNLLNVVRDGWIGYSGLNQYLDHAFEGKLDGFWQSN